MVRVLWGTIRSGLGTSDQGGASVGNIVPAAQAGQADQGFLGLQKEP